MRMMSADSLLTIVCRCLSHSTGTVTARPKSFANCRAVDSLSRAGTMVWMSAIATRGRPTGCEAVCAEQERKMNVTELDIEVFNYSELGELKGRIEARMHDMQEIGVPALVGPGSRFG
jgi:hypothetical protein